MHNRIKSSSNSSSSNIRPITITSNFKCTNITEDQQENQNQKTQPLGQTKKQGVSDKVLELLKNKIKNNYDDLYGNYNNNKQKILKQIQTVETNIAGQNIMSYKQEQLIKQKAKYDKLKAQVQSKQKRLKKMEDLKKQLNKKNNSEMIQDSKQKKIFELQQKRQQIYHNTLILNQMLNERKKNYIFLKHKNNQMLNQLNFKRQKSKKISQQTLKRKNILSKIQQKLQKEQQVEIPQKLAEQLAQKMQIYQNKLSYNNIAQHEAQIQQQRQLRLRDEINQQKQTKRINKIKKDKQSKCQLQQLYNYYLIKSLEEQKIKKFCGSNSINQILNNNKNLDKESLNLLRDNIQSQIMNQQEQNERLQKQIQNLSNKDGIENILSIYDVENILQIQQKEYKILKDEQIKRKKIQSQWKTLLSLITSDTSQNNFKQLISKLSIQYNGDKMVKVKVNKHVKKHTNNTSLQQASQQLQN